MKMVGKCLLFLVFAPALLNASSFAAAQDVDACTAEDFLTDECLYKEDGSCDAGDFGPLCTVKSDCVDCDPCRLYTDSCDSCVGNGCSWCPRNGNPFCVSDAFVSAFGSVNSCPEVFVTSCNPTAKPLTTPSTDGTSSPTSTTPPTTLPTEGTSSPTRAKPPTTPPTAGTSSPTSAKPPTTPPTAGTSSPTPGVSSSSTKWESYCAKGETLTGYPCLPGIENALGFGYDIILDKQTVQVIALEEGHKNTFDIPNIGTYEIPNYVTCQEDYSFGGGQSSHTYWSTHQFQDNRWLEVRVSLFSRKFFSHGKDLKHVRSTAFSKQSFLSEAVEAHTFYSCRLQTVAMRLTDEVQLLIEQRSPHDAVATIGTHIVNEAIFGGVAKARAFVATCTLSVVSVNRISANTLLYFKNIISFESLAGLEWGTTCEMVSQYFVYDRILLGGIYPGPEGGSSDERFASWVNSLRENPTAVVIYLESLLQTFPSLPIQEYIDSFESFENTEVDKSGTESCQGFEDEEGCSSSSSTGKKKCMPLDSQTLVQTDMGIEARRLSDLELGDHVVFAQDNRGATMTSPIINFAHRSDASESTFVVVRTRNGGVIRGSPEHNIQVGVLDGNSSAKLLQDYTFGKLESMLKAGQRVFVVSPFGPAIDHMVEVVSASISVAVGFVAPVTKVGKMVLFAESVDSTIYGKGKGDAPRYFEPAELGSFELIQVSCFSTLPDRVAQFVHGLRMLPVYLSWIPANENTDGVGCGYWNDVLSELGSTLGRWLGHIL